MARSEPADEPREEGGEPVDEEDLREFGLDADADGDGDAPVNRRAERCRGLPLMLRVE